MRLPLMTFVCPGLAVAGALVLGACSAPGFLDTTCAGVGYYAVQVDIRDQFGTPQALGAAVTLTDGSYRETDSTDFDPLSIRAAGERGGRTYDVAVSKRFYRDTVVRNVRAPGGGCVTGHERDPVTITIPVTLRLAPPLRGINLVPHHILLDRHNTTPFAFKAYFDANPDVSREVSWSIVGDTASVGFDTATGLLTYRCRPTSGYLTLTARSTVDPNVLDSADVAVQGHPAATNDPPCTSNR